MTAGFIINPKAHGGNSPSGKLSDALAGKPGLRSELLENFDDLPEILRDYAESGISTIFISSGDGTVQAIQSLLGENNWYETLPRLALLPHGSTNMNALTLGFRTSDISRVLEIAASESYLARATNIKQRHTVRVVNPADKPPQHGMFVGAGTICEATRYCQKVLHERGVRGSWATFSTFASIVGRYLIGKRDENDDERIVRPYDMRVLADGELMVDGPQLSFLASTLESLILGIKPYWGGAGSQMRATTIDYPPPNLATNILKVMYGFPNRNLPAGCRSRAVKTIEINTNSAFVIDGEFFQPPRNEPLKLELGPLFSYLCN
ncbi:MAG: diacylglycerol kinase family protein [Hyphomicrobiales bacterium]